MLSQKDLCQDHAGSLLWRYGWDMWSESTVLCSLMPLMLSLSCLTLTSTDVQRSLSSKRFYEMILNSWGHWVGVHKLQEETGPIPSDQNRTIFPGISKVFYCFQPESSSFQEETKLILKVLLFYFFNVLGHTQLCSGVNPSSALKNYSWWCSRGLCRISEIKPRLVVCKAICCTMTPAPDLHFLGEIIVLNILHHFSGPYLGRQP